MNFIRVVDLETTGFDAPKHAPIEIGWTDLADIGAGWDLAWPRYAQVFCDPGRDIPPEACAIHHIVAADLIGALTWREAVGALDAAISTHGGELMLGKPVAYAAHSAKMERQWLVPELVGDVPWICTWKCALRLWPDAPGHSNQCLRYWRNPAGLTREIADRAHRAGPDAYVTAHLLRDMLAQAPLDDLIAWSAEPALLVRVPFGRSTRGMRWTEVEADFLCWVLDRDFDEDVMFTARIELERRETLLRHARAE